MSLWVGKATLVEFDCVLLGATSDWYGATGWGITNVSICDICMNCSIWAWACWADWSYSSCKAEDNDCLTESKYDLKAESHEAVSDILEMEPSREHPVVPVDGPISGGMWKVTAVEAADVALLGFDFVMLVAPELERLLSEQLFGVALEVRDWVEGC
jgi:hypothetical protein